MKSSDFIELSTQVTHVLFYLLFCRFNLLQKTSCYPEKHARERNVKAQGHKSLLFGLFQNARLQVFPLAWFEELTFPLPPRWFALTYEEKHSASPFLFLHFQWVSPVLLWLIKVYCRRSRSGLRALMKRWLTKQSACDESVGCQAQISPPWTLLLS